MSKIAVLSGIALTLSLALTGAAGADFYLNNTIDLSPAFGQGSALGTNALSVAFDGTSAYLGGYLQSNTAGTIGVAKVGGIMLGETPTFTPLVGSVISRARSKGTTPLPRRRSVVAGKDGANAAVR